METQKKEFTPKERNRAIAVLIVFVLIMLIILTPKKPKSEHTKVDAMVMAREYCRKQLLSPSTAKFEWNTEEEVTEIDPTHFLINSFVDATNSYGVPLRKTFSCKVEFIGDNASVTDFYLEQ